MKKKAFHMSLQQAEEHQRKHGFSLEEFMQRGLAAQNNIDAHTRPKGKLKLPREMNATEREFSHILEAQRRRGEILAYRFEAITLTWGDGMRYKPDFAVLRVNGGLRFIEVKGPKIWDRDIVRFKGCRAHYKDWFFEFEMHQRDRGGEWKQLF